MSDLPYLALPYENESPRSMLIRTAFHNGYDSIAKLSTRLGTPPSYSLQENLLGNSELSKRLTEEKPRYKDKIKNAFYHQIKGPTSKSPVVINNTQIPFSFLRTSGHFICFDCLINDGYIKQIHDINIVDVCPIHKRFLRSTCAQCETSLKWTYPETHSPCQCKKPIIQTQIVTDCSGAKFIQESIESSCIVFLDELKYILRALKFDDEDNVVERNNILNEAVRILKDPIASLRQHLRSKKAQHPNIIIRVIAAPFLASGSSNIAQICLDLLNEYPPEYPIASKNYQSEGGSLTLSETAICLDITYSTLKKLKAYITPTVDSKTHIQRYSYKDLSQFFCLFYSNNNLNLTTSESLSFTAPGKSLIEKIKQIQNGDIEVIESDQRKGLSGVIVPSLEYKTNIRSDEFSDLLDIQEVSTYLNTYKDAVRNIAKIGLLKPITMRGSQPYFDIKQVEEFHNKYIFLKPLSQLMGMDSKKLRNNLKHYGVDEVPIKSVVNFLSPLYLRDDLIKINRLKSRAFSTNKINSIIKIDDVKKKLLPVNNSIKAKDVSQSLGIHIRFILKLENFGLLKRDAYKNNNDINSRYYSKESLMATKRWLGSAKTVEEFSQECRIHRAHFTKRYISNQFITPLRFNDITILISKKDQQRIIAHRNKYCTCSEADLFHNAPEKHFQNLVRTGRIPFVEKSKLTHDFGTTLLEWSVVKKYK
tara:strand:- start:3589 stop:5700 length:2112 start_codon:yes stop_codon:yes gene_type:complete